ncbi:acetate--CoA ligase [Halomonas sp. PAMB 3264]|uniref:acetate--CoA ligase n=1 Tax=Halomonas sp. PAMB 3264 TaxID=3075222 RepID=UPI002897EBCB|nr:acetate--CoA ligase [Halomonas sp. PAMB 3264]WNL43794.1 acetate--CoA ligase [Halomonas sp. PAMB 3264]
MSRYHATHAYSIESPAEFWQEQAQRIPWKRFPETILSWDEQRHARWFEDGTLNICYAALDHHVEKGRGEQVALYYDSPVTGAREVLTYRALRDRVAYVAGGLEKLGVGKGDRVVIYMPMVPEAVIAMLACARIGAVHSVVFGGFAARELALRIEDAEPKVVISASCGIEVNTVLPYKPIVDQAIAQSVFKPEALVVFQREAERAPLNEGEHDWQTLEQSGVFAECVEVEATHPLYILYTSGTTGKPKGVVRDTGGYAVALAYSMEAVYGLAPGDVCFTASDVGWVVGHSYIVYGPLLRGCASVVYEGKPVKTPDAGSFWRIIDEYRVKSFFTAPTAFRAIKKEDPEALERRRYSLASLEHVFVAGERLDPPTFHWLSDVLNVPIIDHWWQTETGWPIAANLAGIELAPAKAGSATYPVPGFNVEIIGREGEKSAAMEEGSVLIKQPLPPGCLSGIWRDPARFHSAYMAAFPGYYLTGDGGYFDDDGYLFIMGRTDDVINVAGHRLSTGEMEGVLGAHPAVAECAVIGIHDDLKGQRPVGFVIPKDGFDGDEAALEAALIQQVRETIGPVAAFKQVLIVNRLPKTRSGKILRKLLRTLADGKPYTVPSTIDDPTSLDDAQVAMSRHGVGRVDEARPAEQ